MSTADLKIDDLKGKSADELTAALVDLKKEQFNLRFQKANGQLTNTAQVRKVRRQIARVKSMTAAKTAGAESTAAAKAAGQK